MAVLQAKCRVSLPNLLQSSSIRLGVLAGWLPKVITPARASTRSEAGVEFDIPVESTTYEPVLQIWLTWSTPAQIGEQWAGRTSVDLHSLVQSNVVQNTTGATWTNTLPYHYIHDADVVLPAGRNHRTEILSITVEIWGANALIKWAGKTRPAEVPPRPDNLATPNSIMDRNITYEGNAQHQIVSECLIDGTTLPLRYLMMTRPARALSWGLVLHWVRLAGAMHPDLRHTYSSATLTAFLGKCPSSPSGECRNGWRMAEAWYLGRESTGTLACAHAGRLLSECIRMPFLCGIYTTDKTLGLRSNQLRAEECDTMNTPICCLGGQSPDTEGVLAGDCEDAATMNHLIFLALRQAFRELVYTALNGNVANFNPNEFGAVHQQLAAAMLPQLPPGSTLGEASLLASLGFLCMQYSEWMTIVATESGKSSAGLHATTVLLPMQVAVARLGKIAYDMEWVPLDTPLTLDDAATANLQASDQPLRYITTIPIPLRGFLVEATNSVCPILDITDVRETQHGTEFTYTQIFVNGAHDGKLRSKIMSALQEVTSGEFDDMAKLISIPCQLSTGEFYRTVLQLVGARSEFILGNISLYELLRPTGARFTRSMIEAPAEEPSAGFHLVANLRPSARRQGPSEIEFASYHARSRQPAPDLRVPRTRMQTPPPAGEKTVMVNLTEVIVNRRQPNGNMDPAGFALDELLPAMTAVAHIDSMKHTAYAYAANPNGTCTGTLLAVTLTE